MANSVVGWGHDLFGSGRAMAGRFLQLFVNVILGANLYLDGFHKPLIFNKAASRRRKKEVAMRNLIVAALAAVGIFAFAPAAEAGCQTYAHQGGCMTQKRVIGYRTVTVRKPIYRTVRAVCNAPGCAPIAASAPVVVQTPPPRVVEVPQRVIVRQVPQVTYLPPAQVRVAPAPCPAPVIAPPVTRAPCGTCGSSVAMVSVYGSGAVEGAACTGQMTGKPGVWKTDPSGRLGCFVGN